MILEGEAFEKELVPEEGVLIYGISAHIKEAPESSLPPSAM